MADSTSPTFSIEDVPQLEFTNDNDIPTGSYDTTTSTVSTVTVTGTTTITSNDTENSPFDLVDFGSTRSFMSEAYSDMLYPTPSSSMYQGCATCYKHSMMFGDSTLNTEEKFEIEKAKFVEHFNKCHRDLLMKKGLPTEKKKFTEVPKEKGITLWTTPYGSSPFNSYYQELSVSGGGGSTAYDEVRAGIRANIQNIYGIPMIVSDEPIYNANRPAGDRGVRVPEYDVKPDIDPRNLDRNSRFREMLRSR